MTASSIKNSILGNKVLTVTLVILLVILFIAMGTILGLIISQRPLTIDKAQDPASLIVRQVKNVSELTTAIFETESVIPVSDKGFIAESKLLYIAHGNARVGVDLGEFEANDVQVEGNKITVNLPPLKVLDSNLDLQHSRVYSYNRGFLGIGPDVVNLQAQAQREAVQKIKEAACQSWLIKTATDRVEKTVDNLLSQVLKNIEIVVKAQPPLESSCFSTSQAQPGNAVVEAPTPAKS